MPRCRVLVILLCLLMCASGCGRQEEATAQAVPAKPRPTKPRKAPEKNFATPWQDESEYIVTQVTADLAEMAYFAKHGRALPGEALPVEVHDVTASKATVPVYRVVVHLPESGDISCDLAMTTPIWAPATYQPLVELLFVKLPPAATNASKLSSTNLLGQLQVPRPELLARLDKELSNRLTQEFTSAERHEEAALLLGSFALREAAGLFYQIRVELCRMTAHLAFADGLRGERQPSTVGRLAEATLMALCRNQVRALKILEAIPEAGDTGVWKRALRMRLTGDFRIIGESRTQTLWEQLEWFRARAGSINVDRAWTDLRLFESWRPLADWTRMANWNGASIGLGHALLEAGLDAEAREEAVVFAEECGGELSAGTVVAALNAEPQRCVTRQPDGSAAVHVLGWGLWSSFLQRHLAHTLVSDFHFLQLGWGVPEEAKKYREAMDPQYAGLRLYPFVRRHFATQNAYYHRAQDDEMALIHSAPQLVPAGAWNYVCNVVPFGPLYIPPPHAYVNEWHRRNPPPGTAYDLYPRMNHPSLVDVDSGGVKRLEVLHLLAPYDELIDHNLLRIRDGDRLTAAQAAEVFSAVLDYSPSANRRMGRLSTKEPEQQENWIRRAAALDPSEYRTLAEFFVQRHREPEAATAYEQWIATETDEVLVAQSADWMIFYLERTGNTDGATVLADRAAATYAARGLLSKAHLLEQRHDAAGALESYQAQAERYDDPGPLIGFLQRLKIAGGMQYPELLDRLLAQYLPGGFVKSETALLPAPPRIGVLVHTQITPIREVNLEKGDIVVAVRGYRVTDWQSFKILRGLEPEKPYGITLWRRDHYLDLLCPAGYRFGIDLTDYHAK